MKRKNLQIGFTLLELLVVIAIIGILAALGLANYRSAIDKGKMAQTQGRMRELRTMMEQYRLQYGTLPVSDGSGLPCSDCVNPPNDTWTTVLGALQNAGILSANQRSKYEKDAWGNYYGYDNNDQSCCGSFSQFYTVGPNKTRNRDRSKYVEGDNCLDSSNNKTDDWCLDFPYGN